MAIDLDRLKAYVTEHETECDGDIDGVLHMIYQFYLDNSCCDSQPIVNGFCDLYRIAENLPTDIFDNIIDAVCDLCTEYEHLAFEEGVRIGARLFMELKG